MTEKRLGAIPWGAPVGAVALAACLLAPPPLPLTEIGMARLGLLAFAVIWWTATPYPLAFTTLVTLALGIASGALTVSGAFAHASTWIMWFVIGSFGLAASLEATGVNRRFALAFLDLPWVRGHPRRFLMMFLVSATLMSGIMANTVVAVIWLSLAAKIYAVLDVSRGDQLVEANTLGIAWAANIGGIATPVGNGTNAAAIALIASATGVTVTFLQWTIIGTLMTALLMAAALLLVRLTVSLESEAFARPETARFIAAERLALGPMPVEERWAIGWFAVAILLWFLPDVARLAAPEAIAAAVGRSLHMSVPALLVPAALCILPAPGSRGTRVLTWEKWVGAVDWSLVLFIGGVMGLGTAVGEEATGLPEYVRTVLGPSLGHLSEYSFVLLITLGAIVLTSVISNMVTLAIFVPLGMTLAQSLGIADPVAVAIVLGIGVSLAHVLPSGTTTNAIVAGSGFLPISLMVRQGIILVGVHAVLLTYVGYPLTRLILGR